MQMNHRQQGCLKDVGENYGKSRHYRGGNHSFQCFSFHRVFYLRLIKNRKGKTLCDCASIKNHMFPTTALPASGSWVRTAQVPSQPTLVSSPLCVVIISLKLYFVNSVFETKL